jgi:SAM-dependent methyltransferase
MAVERFNIDSQKQVVEIASNDGYLLQYMIEKGIPVLGIEPAANIAEVAEKKGIPTLVKFFGVDTAREVVDQGTKADLLIGNNVLAHVPALNDFVGGLKILLAPDGVITMEVPHAARMLELNQFDTIYQEHYSYYSLISVQKVFQAHGLTIFDVDEISTHGGSLRIYACHDDCQSRSVGQAVEGLLQREKDAGLDDLAVYRKFGEQVIETKRKLLEFLIKAKREGKTIAGYGAPGKGNTLLNYCGIRQDFIDYTVDRNPFKHGMYLPGTRIPVYPPEKIAETKPDYVLLLPWNLREELVEQLDYVREWGAKFIVPIPEVEVF